MAGQVDAVALVLESHMPTLLAWLRPGEDAEALLDDLQHAIEVCATRDILLEVEVPFMTENASSLAATVTSLGSTGVRTVRIVPAREVPGREHPLDPFACFSERYIERIEMLCAESAQAEGVRLVWEPRAGATFEISELAGFCEDAWGRVSVGRDGRVSPCVYAARGELELGTLTVESLSEIWRGRESLDLRRAHLTWDYPDACTSCSRSTVPRAERAAPFMARFAVEMIGWRGPEAAIEPLSPGPSARRVSVPKISLAPPVGVVRAWHFAWSRGGTAEGLEAFEVQPDREDGPAVNLTLPAEAWEGMEPNTGYWWAVFAELATGAWIVTPGARCLVSHESLPRVGGSRLRYPGAARRVKPAALSASMDEAEYDALVRRVRAAILAVVPEGAIAVVVSRGDERLGDLGAVQGWHFPRAENGAYAGFHPPDGHWAVEHLRSLQANGAQYLVVPETASWWYAEYPQFAAYVHERSDLVLEERGTCVVVALRGDEDS